MDGAFERINAAILKEGTNSQVISLVGRVVGYDGNGQATVEAADGGMVQVTNVEPAFNYVEGMIAEIMGAPIGGDSIQYFLCRNLGDDFDLTNYNKLIYNVMKNQRYADLY